MVFARLWTVDTHFLRPLTLNLLLVAGLATLGCSDPAFMDKTVLTKSLIRAEAVSADSSLAKKVVLITQSLKIENKTVHLFGLCTGVIVGPKAILTAAHCLKNGTASMKVILNVNPRSGLTDNASDIYSVVDSQIHSEYKSYLLEFASLEERKQNPDLAILYVDRNLDTSFASVQLLTDYSDYMRKTETLTITMAGYGKTTALKDTSRIAITELNGVLKKATVQLASRDIGLAEHGETYFEMHQDQSAGICHGDSGAPLFLEANNKSYLFALAVGVYRNHKADDDLLTRRKFSDCAGSGLYINLQLYHLWISSTAKELIFRNEM